MHFRRRFPVDGTWCQPKGGEVSGRWDRVTCPDCHANWRRYVERHTPGHLDLFPLPVLGAKGAA